MPTYFRSGSVMVRLFNGDHNPPHCHIVTPDGELQVGLGDLSVLRGRLAKHEYELALAWIEDNIELLRSEWTRLNG